MQPELPADAALIQSPTPPTIGTEKKRRPKKLIFVLIIVLILLIGGALLLFGHKKTAHTSLRTPAVATPSQVDATNEQVPSGSALFYGMLEAANAQAQITTHRLGGNTDANYNPNALLPSDATTRYVNAVYTQNNQKKTINYQEFLWINSKQYDNSPALARCINGQAQLAKFDPDYANGGHDFITDSESADDCTYQHAANDLIGDPFILGGLTPAQAHDWVLGLANDNDIHTGAPLMDFTNVRRTVYNGKSVLAVDFKTNLIADDAQNPNLKESEFVIELALRDGVGAKNSNVDLEQLALPTYNLQDQFSGTYYIDPGTLLPVANRTQVTGHTASSDPRTRYRLNAYEYTFGAEPNYDSFSYKSTNVPPSLLGLYK